MKVGEGEPLCPKGSNLGEKYSGIPTLSPSLPPFANTRGHLPFGVGQSPRKHRQQGDHRDGASLEREGKTGIGGVFLRQGRLRQEEWLPGDTETTRVSRAKA